MLDGLWFVVHCVEISVSPCCFVFTFLAWRLSLQHVSDTDVGMADGADLITFARALGDQQRHDITRTSFRTC
jgi:hypothetical protein